MRTLLALSIAVLAALSAADAAAQTAGPTGAPPVEDADAALARLADRIPGFAGAYFDERGRKIVLSTRQAANVKQLQSVFGGDATVQAARYDFRELYSLKLAASELLGFPNVVFVDLDEQANRIRIGIHDAGMKQRERADFTERLARSLPADALIFESIQPIENQASLRNRVIPAPGGVQVENPKRGYCTLGFIAKRNGASGFITNSHCTTPNSAGFNYFGVGNGPFDPSGSKFFQATNGTPLFGVEAADPQAFTLGNCPLLRRCRYSDAAFVRLQNSGQGNFGRIAKTANRSLTIAGTYPIAGTANGAAVGATVYRVGRSTGTTSGRVTQTCVDVNAFESGIDTYNTLLCQTLFNAGSTGGDSGSPVFTLSGGRATLRGIAWGGNGSVVVFSPWGNVTRELGALSVK